MKEITSKMNQEEKNSLVLSNLLEGNISGEEFAKSWKGRCYVPTVYSTIKNTLTSCYYQILDSRQKT
jgi:hypothetical protein